MQDKTICLPLLALALFAASEGTTYNPRLWSGMRYRMIGPERGARAATVTGVPSQPYTFDMGSTGGGVWKTTDGGHTWANVSDGFFAVASRGAVEVSPNIVSIGRDKSVIERSTKC